VANPQGVFVASSALTAAGTPPSVPGQVPATVQGRGVSGPPLLVGSQLEPASVSEPAGPSTFDVQAAPVPASVASSASVLPVGLVDQVFADLDQLGSVPALLDGVVSGPADGADDLAGSFGSA